MAASLGLLFKVHGTSSVLRLHCMHNKDAQKCTPPPHTHLVLWKLQQQLVGSQGSLHVTRLEPRCPPRLEPRCVQRSSCLLHLRQVSRQLGVVAIKPMRSNSNKAHASCHGLHRELQTSRS